MTKLIDYSTLAADTQSSMLDGNDLSTKRFDSAVVAWANAGAKWQETGHGLAMTALRISMPHKEGGHNDASRALKLITAMPNGSRRKTMIAWFHAFSNVRFQQPKGKPITAGLLGPALKHYRDVDLIAADAKPFHSVEEIDTPIADFDDKAFATSLERFIKRASSDKAKLSPAVMSIVAGLKVDLIKIAA